MHTAEETRAGWVRLIAAPIREMERLELHPGRLSAQLECARADWRRFAGAQHPTVVVRAQSARAGLDPR